LEDVPSAGETMDILYFIIIILVLVAAYFFLRRNEKKTKNKYKIDAYRLLDAPNPSTKEIISAIKMLRLYGGTWRKDKEFVELVSRLRDRLEKIEAA
jgi:LPXTG-motif cell wall-anchored protein